MWGERAFKRRCARGSAGNIKYNIFSDNASFSMALR